MAYPGNPGDPPQPNAATEKREARREEKRNGRAEDGEANYWTEQETEKRINNSVTPPRDLTCLVASSAAVGHCDPAGTGTNTPNSIIHYTFFARV